MTLSGGKALSTQTDARGTYAFGGLPAGRNYTLTPTLNLLWIYSSSTTFNLTSFGQRPTSSPPHFPSCPSRIQLRRWLKVQAPYRSRLTGATTPRVSPAVSRAVPIETFSYAPCGEVHGTASISCDYTITTGILTFNPGETTKSFTVLINDDAYVEGNETFNYQLINPNGGAPVWVSQMCRNHDYRQ